MSWCNDDTVKLRCKEASRLTILIRAHLDDPNKVKSVLTMHILGPARNS